MHFKSFIVFLSGQLETVSPVPPPALTDQSDLGEEGCAQDHSVKVLFTLSVPCLLQVIECVVAKCVIKICLEAHFVYGGYGILDFIGGVIRQMLRLIFFEGSDLFAQMLLVGD
jgi:hypothetical protein